MPDERTLPPPVHTSRDPWPAGMPVPSPAAKLQRGAEAAGWSVQVTYAQGFACPPKLADPPYPLATVAVRFQRSLGSHVRGGYVVYHCRLDRAKVAWVGKSCMVFGTDHNPVVTGLGVTDVGRYLVDGPDWTGAWVTAWSDQLKAKKADADERTRVAARERPKKGKVV